MAIDEAERNIHENGMLAIKARHIAKSIGCAVGSLYNHFSCIDDLILAVNLRTLANLKTELRQATLKTVKGNQGIQTVVDTYIKFALEHTHAWQALFEHHLPTHTEIPQVYFQQRQQLFQHIEEQLRAAHPQMNETNIKLESRALWAGIQGICILAINKKRDDDHIPFQGIANTLVQHFLSHPGV